VATARPAAELAERIGNRDRRALAKAITLVESLRAEHRDAAADLMSELPRPQHPTIRLGISGVPGVGKSTFIEAFGLHVIERRAPGRGAGRRPVVEP
jgi:LAO/AO transport system kinase